MLKVRHRIETLLWGNYIIVTSFLAVVRFTTLSEDYSKVG